MSDHADVPAAVVGDALFTEGLSERPDLAERCDPAVHHAFRLKDVIHILTNHPSKFLETDVVFAAGDRERHTII